MTLLISDLIDTPITEFKYYRHGSSQNSAAYGLYDIVADRFLIVLPNKEITKQLKCILSSRYQLYICQLDTAVNYKDFHIDNSNCDQWTLANKEDVKFSNMMLPAIISVEQLQVATSVPKYNVLNEKLWCLFCSHWLHKLNNMPDHIDDRYSYIKLDNFLNGFLDIDEVQYSHNWGYQKKLSLVKNDILKLLYLSRDFNTAESAINQLIDYE